MTLDRLIRLANDGYDSDDMILQNYEADRPSEQHYDPGVGDTLALAMVRELRDTFDEDASNEAQVREAVRVLTVMRDDLNHVLEVFSGFDPDECFECMDGRSSYCGSFCPTHWAAHLKECEVCRRDEESSP